VCKTVNIQGVEPLMRRSYRRVLSKRWWKRRLGSPASAGSGNMMKLLPEHDRLSPALLFGAQRKVKVAR
jgi:hypothetical protein